MTIDYSLLAVAVALCAAGVAETFGWNRKKRADLRWRQAAIQTEGIVQRIDERESYSAISEDAFKHSVSRVAVITFRAQDGRDYQIEASGEDRFVGAKVPLAYNPELPSDARAFEPNAYRGGCGLILIAIAIALAAKAVWW